MAAQPTTRWQVSGYRFLVRRMEHALVRRDVRMLHDPMRAQSRALAVGVVIACIGLAGCAALALIRPQDKIGNASIVIGKDSGAMFVVMDGTLHPVLNLASARLVVGESAKPVMIKESEIDTRPRGALVGIPGAPSALPAGGGTEGQPWSVCDTVSPDGRRPAATTVVVGEPTWGDRVGQLDSGHALLVSHSDATFLVYDGHRAPIDLEDQAVTRALGLEGAQPRPISRGMLNAIPETLPIAAPDIDGAGSAPNYEIAGRTIGSVVKVKRGDDARYYVVLRDGVQEVSEATAVLIHFSDSQGQSEVPTVAPDALAKAPTSHGLDVATFPSAPPRLVDDADKPVSCLTWTPQGSVAGDDAGRVDATLAVSAGRALPIPDDARTVRLAQADGPGDNADAVYVRPGGSGFVQTTGLESGSSRKGGMFFVADTGVRYGVKNADAAKALGFDVPGPPAPWRILELLAPGPTLGREEALVAHDGVAPDDAAAPVAAGN
ncbi:type VII secretion protein EccB [Prescottella agglutinans]|uniref:Type VII secretion protein EccB n=1 Tax=Prescottella agglutinans TaxID=1644129 RepID=A0ABT6M4E5_9NOCA|nr:type VII secretion protein EccB [Prescottella agglutinans]MDH6279183.1 type VII secretion protein EccB [Prescottella agglutinans]